ncbi:hypothetical protein [uncultured Roseovarius sp.]|uniref:hypothetical protein n=1 Tax=uncultured Roseovarius sp. TaxID=293344 RepID=UPI00262D39BB|nr:hypothetical protein [uncultured Roseovarius sp.]
MASFPNKERTSVPCRIARQSGADLVRPIRTCESDRKSRCGKHEWRVFTPRSGAENNAAAAIFLLRALAAKIRRVRCGLKLGFQCVSCQSLLWLKVNWKVVKKLPMSGIKGGMYVIQKF